MLWRKLSPSAPAMFCSRGPEFSHILEGAVGRQMDLEKEQVLGEKLLSDFVAFILHIGLFLEMVRFKLKPGCN